MLTHIGPTAFLIPTVSCPVMFTHSSIASGMPTGEDPALSKDLKKALDGSITGPPSGILFLIAGESMDDTASLAAVYGQSPDFSASIGVMVSAGTSCTASSHGGAPQERSTRSPDVTASELPFSRSAATLRTTAARRVVTARTRRLDPDTRADDGPADVATLIRGVASIITRWGVLCF